MKLLNRDLTIANRFIYYYANFVKRIYGFVVRREGKNVWTERQVGRLPARKPSAWPVPRTQKRRAAPGTPQEQGDKPGDLPGSGEIVLFRYRKRLMLGYCRKGSARTVSVVSEDRRRLHLSASMLIYETGIRLDKDGDALTSFVDSARELSSNVDLQEIWELLTGDQETLTISEIASLYWNGAMDTLRWVALYLHLEDTSPYFEARMHQVYALLSAEEVEARKALLAREAALGEELAEFIHWSSLEGMDYDAETLTRRQNSWLEHIRMYALWGQRAPGQKQARKILPEVVPGTKDLERSAFDLLVRKGIWSEHENLDLLRAELTPHFPDDVVRESDRVGRSRVLKGRRRLWRRRLFSLDEGKIAISLRRRWGRGYELGVHIPDLSDLVPRGSALDREACNRMASLILPDAEIPMLPHRISTKLGRFQIGEPTPAMSILWKLDKGLAIRESRIIPSRVKLHHRLSNQDLEAISDGKAHPLAGPLRILGRVAEALRSAREEAGAFDASVRAQPQVSVEEGKLVVESKDVNVIQEELAILACQEVGKYCAEREIPVIYETRDTPMNLSELAQIPNRFVRRHEIRRQTPSVKLSAEAAFHHGLGLSAYVPVTMPQDRYVDLMMQCQVVHDLIHGEVLYARDEIDLIRYRAQEELRQLDRLRHRRERYVILRNLSESTGSLFPAVVLYLRRDGALVELADLPVKIVVRSLRQVSVGEVVQLRLVGVDLWRARAHVVAT